MFRFIRIDTRHGGSPRLGDIGEEGEVIEIEPFPEVVPVHEPAAPAIPTPEKVPA